MERTDYENPSNRIMYYHEVLSSDTPATITHISNETGIPIEVIRKDFSEILSADPYFFNLDEDKVAEKIMNGLYDNEIITAFRLTKWSENESDIISIPVSVDEYLAFQNLYESSSVHKKATSEKSFITSAIRNKKYVNEYDVNVLNNLEEIETDILEDCCCSFQYLHPTGKQEKVTVKPIKIGLDATENRYVIISTDKDQILVHELDRIIGPVSPEINSKIESHPEYLDDYDKVWGFEFDKCIEKAAKPLHIKMVFYDHGNVIEKAKRALVYRNPIKLTEVIRDGERMLLYEDYVYGKDSFINWVLGFGGSARIIQPKSIINEIRIICSKALQRQNQ